MLYNSTTLSIYCMYQGWRTFFGSNRYIEFYYILIQSLCERDKYENRRNLYSKLVNEQQNKCRYFSTDAKNYNFISQHNTY